MTLTQEQAEAVKQQLLKQLDNFPEDKQELIKNKIISMSLEEVEAFVKENQLSHMEQNSSQTPQQSPSTECIFCNIASKTIPSTPLDEDKENLAVLELNPLSKGHCLVIPKNHLETQQIPSSTFEIAKKIARIIQEKFNPKEIKINTQTILNHALLEVLPLYGDEKERKKATEEELKQLQNILKETPKPKPEIKKQEPIPDSELQKLKPRIP